MASVYADPRLRNKRHYIAAAAFDSYIYSYATSMSPSTFVTTGSLGSVKGATATNCPQGHILRENGKRLYPDAHPGISTMMVGVYDANSGLSGYIDPNAPQFAVFNSDKPVEMVDGGDNNNVAVPHKGQPVYTRGDVIAEGNAIITGDITATTGDITATAGDITATAGDITATAGIIVSKPVYSISGSGDITIDAAQYSHAVVTITGAANIIVSNVSQGRTLDLVVIASGGNYALTFNIASIYAGGSFNRTLNNGTRLGIRMVAMTDTQMYPVSDCLY